MRTHPPSKLSCFTVIELLVVVAIIGVLAALLLPALSKAKARGQSIACLNNLKQLQLSWHMYVDDHNDTMPPNIVGKAGRVEFDLPGSWALGNGKLDIAISNIESGVLYPYNRNPQIYRCPANRVTATTSLGKHLLVIRTYSLEYQLNASGDVAAWNNSPYFLYSKLSAIHIPTLSQMWTFIEPNEASLDDGGYFILDTDTNIWGHLPDDLHAQGCNLSFADGHAESYRWKWPKAGRLQGSHILPGADRDDYNRLNNGRPHE